MLRTLLCLAALAASPPSLAAAQAPDRGRGCADLEIHTIEIEGRVQLSIRGTRFVERAVPIVATIGGRRVEGLLIGAAGSVVGIAPASARRGDLLVIGYADGTETWRCPMP